MLVWGVEGRAWKGHYMVEGYLGAGCLLHQIVDLGRHGSAAVIVELVVGLRLRVRTRIVDGLGRTPLRSLCAVSEVVTL